MFRIIISFSLLAFVSCQQGGNIFNGEFISLGKKTHVELYAEKLEFETFGAGSIYILDSMLVSFTPMRQDNFVTVYCLHSFKHLGSFLTKGTGPNEFTHLKFVSLYQSENGESIVCFQTYSDDNFLIALNLTQSIKNQKDIYEKDAFIVSANEIIKANNMQYMSEVIYAAPGKAVSINSIPLELSDLTVFDLDNPRNPIKSKFALYRRVIPFESTFGVKTIKPDGEKFAQAMMFSNQINICDITGENAKSISYSKTPTFIRDNEILHPHSSKMFYRDIISTDDYIIAVYLPNDAKHTELHIFDWEGKIINIFKINAIFPYLALDKTGGNIYGFQSDEEIYKIYIGDYIKL